METGNTKVIAIIILKNSGTQYKNNTRKTVTFLNQGVVNDAYGEL